MALPTEGVDTNAGVLEAINHAIENEGELLDPVADPTPESEDEVVEGDESEESGDESPEEGETDDAEEGEGESAERNADGTFKKRNAEGQELGPDGKPLAAKPEVAKKAPDAVNDPIPKELKKETQDRIRTLIDTTKEVTKQYETVRQDFDFMVKGVQATGASPEQYGEMLSWMALFNSNDPAQQVQALEVIESVAERLATLLGKERTIQDPLAAYPDLKAAVQQGHATPQMARELARVRNQTNFRGELTTAARTQQTSQQQAQQAEAQARTDLNNLEQQLSADPQYAQIKAAILPALKVTFKSIPHANWAPLFRQAYDQAKAQLASLPPPVAPKPAVPKNQPMRAGKNPPAGNVNASTSGGNAGALASMNAALANAR